MKTGNVLILVGFLLAVLLAVSIVACCTYWPDDTGMAVVIGILIVVGVVALLAGILGLRERYKKGIDLFAKLETDPEKVKSHMLFVMQWGHHEGIKGAFREFNDIFRNYPDWHLQDWEVFRAWYKDNVDHFMEHPDIYQIAMKDGSPYSPEKDPLYDPGAPDWEQFDSEHDYDYDDDDYDDDDFDDEDEYYDEGQRHRRSLAEEAAEGFAFGAGLGVALGPMDGHVGGDSGGGDDGGGSIGF